MTATQQEVFEVLNESEEGEILSLPTSEPEVLAFCDRILRELGDTRAEAAANDAALKVEIERLRNRFTDLNGVLERRETRLLGYLEQMAHNLPMRGKKSRALAFGEMGWTHESERLVIEDPDATLEWVRQLPSFEASANLLRTKKVESVDKKALDAYCAKERVVPKGAVIQPAREKFWAKPSADAPVL